MTIKESLEKYGASHGLWPDEIQIVLSGMPEALRLVWNGSFDGYPKPFKTIALATFKQGAIDYLSEYKPKHFALALLKGEVPELMRD